VLITDAGLHRITMHDSTTHGTSAWGERGAGPAQFFQPRDLIPAQEHLYLLGSGNRRGQVLSRRGAFGPSSEGRLIQ